MNSLVPKPFRCLLVLLIAMLFTSGCSTSSDSTLDGSQSAADVSGSIEDTAISENSASGSTNEMENATIGDTTSGTQAESTDSENESTSGISEPSIPDPVVQSFTRVEFSITVPAYQSNALRVRLSWDAKAFNANWIGDELWAASDDFPTNTKHDLVVTFSDANGDVTLGQYKSAFKTGTNDSEDYQITADQFNIDQWDSDGDGSSNFAESISGADPLIDESSVLDVRDTYNLRSGFVISGFSLSGYETRIPAMRPYFEYFEESPTTDFYTDRETHLITIEIDEIGTGSISDRYRYAGAADRDITIENQEATRTKTDDAVVWNGVYQKSNSGAGVGEEVSFDIETKLVAQSSFMQTASIEKEEVGISNGVVQSLAYSLIGRVDSETTRCEPTSGSVVNDIRYTNSPLPHTVATVSKGVEDDFWAISEATPDGEILEEYFARKLVASFYCDFEDL